MSTRGTASRALGLRISNGWYLFAAGILLLATAQEGFSQNFSGFREPQYPGERMVTAVLDLKGLPVNRVSVTLVFSDKEDAVRNAFDLRKRNPSTYTSGQAHVQALANGKARCTFIFPHRDLPGGAGTVYNNPATVHYAWAESFTPSGASAELTLTSPVRAFVMPRVLRIAYMGDSYASGEGAPNKAGGNDEEKWDDKNCHRSQKSGGVLAIEKLKDEHPEWAIRYINVTCSGATLNDFFEGDSRPSAVIGGVGWSKPAQFQQVQAWLKGGFHLDILLTDGGGNDVGFAPIGTSAMTAFVADISKDADVKAQVQNGLSGLPAGYEAINNFIESEFYGFGVGRVVWVNYPNPLNDKTGTLCSPSSNGNDLLGCWGVVERLISVADFRYLRDVVFAGLNSAVKKAADKHSWDLADVSQSSTTHGMCNCDVPYFNTIGQALSIQGDPMGTMHPNARGFRAMRDPIFRQLERSIGLWHGELADVAKADAKARAIASAKAKSKAKALAAAKAQAAGNTATAKPKPILRRAQPIPTNVKRTAFRLDAEDLKPVTKRKVDDPNK